MTGPRILLLLAVLGVIGTLSNEATAEELALIDYVKSNGGMVKYTIGRSCPTCLRGAIATEDIAAEDLVLAIPLRLGIPLPRLDHQGFASEYAHGLIRRFKSDSEFNKTYSLLWSTQPKPGEILTSETFTDKLLSMLQLPELARILKLQRNVAEDVYYGRYHWYHYDPLPEVLTGDAAVSLDEFLYVTSVVSTRDFALTPAEGKEGEADQSPTYMLLPVADMVNHEDVPAASRSDNATHVLMHAVRDIKAGEAVTNNYQPNVIYRNDMALYIYGFIQESNADRMCAVDLPLYNPGAPFGATENDSWFYGPDGQFNTPQELARLRSLLEQAEGHSSIEEDEALLNSGETVDWKEETVVKFRMWRKKALRRAIAVVETELQNEAESPDGESKEESRDEL